jgi:hypothetical protein
MTSVTMTGRGELLEERRRHRWAVIRMAAMYTPGAALVLTLLGMSLWALAHGSYGAIVPAIILGLVGAALTFQAVAALRDLFAEPATTTGTVRRAWSKGMLLGFFRTNYVLVSRAVFDLSIVSYSQVQEGDQLEVHHWPHTKAVISVYKLKAERESQETRNKVQEQREQVMEELRKAADADFRRERDRP